MRWLWIVISLVGLAGIAVGLLWFLQGSDLLHLDPIACATKCAPVEGRQPAWQTAGAASVAIGLVVTATGWRKLRN